MSRKKLTFSDRLEEYFAVAPVAELEEVVRYAERLLRFRELQARANGISNSDEDEE